jgi:hypothetical protein
MGTVKRGDHAYADAVTVQPTAIWLNAAGADRALEPETLARPSGPQTPEHRTTMRLSPGLVLGDILL